MSLYFQLRAQLLSIESRYKAEISDLNDLLKENRRRTKEMEDELRKEIASLKAIIRDLEGRLGNPCHEKTCLCHMRTTKAQISLHIHTV